MFLYFEFGTDMLIPVWSHVLASTALDARPFILPSFKQDQSTMSSVLFKPMKFARAGLVVFTWQHVSAGTT